MCRNPERHRALEHPRGWMETGDITCVLTGPASGSSSSGNGNVQTRLEKEGDFRCISSAETGRNRYATSNSDRSCDRARAANRVRPRPPAPILARCRGPMTDAPRGAGPSRAEAGESQASLGPAATTALGWQGSPTPGHPLWRTAARCCIPAQTLPLCVASEFSVHSPEN